MADNDQIHHEINYIEFEIADMVQSKRFYFKDPSGNELAVWSDK